MILNKLTLTIVLLLGLAAAGFSAPAQASNVGRLAGAWEIQGTPDANPCGAVPFTNLATITRDGQIVNVDPVLGAAVGSSYRIAPRRFAVGFFGFINSPQGVLRYEVQGTLKIVDPGEVKGDFRTFIVDAANNPVCSYEGEIVGYRQVPLPY